MTGIGLDSDASMDSNAFASSETKEEALVGLGVDEGPPETRLLSLRNKFIGFSLAKNLLRAGVGLEALVWLPFPEEDDEELLPLLLADDLVPVLPLLELPIMPGMAPPNILCIAGGIIPGPIGPPKPDMPIGPIIGFIIDGIGDIMPEGPIIGNGLIELMLDIMGFPGIIEAAIIGLIIDRIPGMPPIGIGLAGAAIVT